MARASVTLVFDNSDSERSPHGYEQYDQITVERQVPTSGRHTASRACNHRGRPRWLAHLPTPPAHRLSSHAQVAIGGRNKYLINGVGAQQERVKNLFHSVQLNVNNPHFLARSLPPQPSPRRPPPLGATAPGCAGPPGASVMVPRRCAQIMQGRITKVINMKPEEVLGMIEEAAGASHSSTRRAHPG